MGSFNSEKQAPPGKHLFSIAWGQAGRGFAEHEPFKTFKEGRAKIDLVREYTRQYYSDLDEITEWTGYQWLKVYGTTHLWKPVRRVPLEVKGLSGLYFVGCTTEVEGGLQEIEANAVL